MNRSRLLSLVAVLLLSACPARVGPYVTDIFMDDEGRLFYRRCVTEVRASGQGGGSPNSTSGVSTVSSENEVDCETVMAPGSGAAQTKQRLSRMDEVVPALEGSPALARVKLEPPSGFAPSEKHAGWFSPKAQSFISVTELSEAFSQVSARYSKSGVQGMTTITREDLRTLKQPAVLVYASRNLGDTPYREWLLLRGNETSTVIVRGAFPSVESNQVGAAVERAVRSSELAAP